MLYTIICYYMLSYAVMYYIFIIICFIYACVCACIHIYNIHMSINMSPHSVDLYAEICRYMLP